MVGIKRVIIAQGRHGTKKVRNRWSRGKVAAHLEPVMNANYRLAPPPPIRGTAIGGYPEVTSNDVLGEPLHYSNRQSAD